jgi:hypothetical protein
MEVNIMKTYPELVKKLKLLAEEYDNHMYSAKDRVEMMNSDSDAIMHDEYCAYADQTLDEILDELKKYEFDGHDDLYNHHPKQIIGDAIVKVIESLKIEE